MQHIDINLFTHLIVDGLHDYCKPFETSPNHFLVTVEEEEEEDDITVVTVKRLDVRT